MNVFIDTSLSGCSIALFQNNSIVAKVYDPIERGIAEVILPHYQSLLQQSNISPSDIDNIYVTVGPGSFTGLRVGLTVAKFIAFSLQKPIFGITSFQALSAGVDNRSHRMMIIETKRADYYCQLMDENHKALSEGENLSGAAILEKLRGYEYPVIITGDAVHRFTAEVGEHEFDIIAQSSVNLEKIITAIDADAFDYHQAEAFYIREADTSTPKPTTL